MRVSDYCEFDSGDAGGDPAAKNKPAVESDMLYDVSTANHSDGSTTNSDVHLNVWTPLEAVTRCHSFDEFNSNDEGDDPAADCKQAIESGMTFDVCTANHSDSQQQTPIFIWTLGLLLKPRLTVTSSILLATMT